MAINPQGLLLDLDGTLADSLGVMRAVYAQYVTNFGGVPSEAEFNSLNGPPLRKIVENLKQTYAISNSVDDLYMLYNRFIDEAYDDVKPTEGAFELLGAAQKNSCKVGIITSNSRARTERWIKIVKIEGYIDFIVSGEEVTKGKPDPEPYLMGIAKIGAPAESIVGVEDSAQGLQSVLHAGLAAYGLRIALEGAVTIDSLGELAKRLW